MKKTLASLLSILGFIFLLVALMSGFYAVSSLLDRIHSGHGLLFADVEIFTMITILFIVLGVLCLWIYNRIKKQLPKKEQYFFKLISPETSFK